MKTGFIYHPACLTHDMGPEHPESPARLAAIIERLERGPLWAELDIYTAHRAEDRHLLAIHHPRYLEQVKQLSPQHGMIHAGPDTAMSPGSLEAAYRAAGTGIQAVDGIMNHFYRNAFCATRPPGHHAEPATTMGFCFFHNLGVAARYLRQTYHIKRICVIDFDVHQGNGTVEIFRDDPDVLFLSSFQHPFYPNSHWQAEHPHMHFAPLAADTDGTEIRQVWQRDWRAAIRAHQPEFFFISAGFDAHEDDPLGELNWSTEDYRWLTEAIMVEADTFAQGRIVSFLEGGYDVYALAECVETHLAALMGR